MVLNLMGLFLLSIVICLIELPGLAKNESWREIITFFVLLLLGNGLIILKLL